MIYLKNEEEIELLRENNLLVSRTLAEVGRHIRPGVTTKELDRIGEEFIRVFEEEAKKIGAVDFLVQGTIYPDVVESGLGGESAVIKSHHNVGGLPEHVDFKEIIEPLRNLFKDEVRKVGLELGIPEKLVFRQPFPGPGLGIRIIGESRTRTPFIGRRSPMPVWTAASDSISRRLPICAL